MGLYEKILKQGKEITESLQIPFKVKKEHKNLELKILEVEQEIANNDVTIQKEQSNSPVNWNKLLEAIDTKELSERKLKKLKELEKTMFLFFNFKRNL